MDPKILVWYTAGTVVLSALLSALRPDNTFLPFSVTTRSRVFLTFAIGVLMVAVQTYFKQPISDAAMAALGSMGTGFALAGAPRAAVGLILCFAIASTSACSVFTPKRVNGVVKITECVLAKRNLPPAQVAIECGIENPQEVVDIVTGEDRRLASARAVGESEGRTLGCKR